MSEKLDILLEKTKSLCSDINSHGGRIYMDGQDRFIYVGNSVNYLSAYDVLTRYEKLRSFINDVYIELDGISREVE